MPGDRPKEKQCAVGLRPWQFEVLSCFATYRFERPETVFPKVNLSDFEWQAVELTHPLLDRPVSNSVTLVGPGSALIITGSNMSGKTTFMRSLGINTVMALAGLPVSARDMSISWQHVMTSMRLKDSLERGVSYFYAEVQRMKLLLDLVQQYPKRSLFLLDEVFMGTNTAERQIASQRLVQLLLEHGASGCVTTHDLSLCELSVTNSKVRNVHFRDQIIDGQMSFDYTLREGVVTTTNALSVLRLSGIPV
jgi:DNA mismatch repair ATPase MutS